MVTQTELSTVLLAIWTGANLDTEIETLTGPDYENWDPAIQTQLDIVVGKFIFNPVVRDDLGNNVTLPVEKAWLVITSHGDDRFTMSIDVEYTGGRTMTLEINASLLAVQFLAQLPDNPTWKYRLPPSVAAA